MDELTQIPGTPYFSGKIKQFVFFSDERLQIHLKAAVVCLKAHMMLTGQVCDKDGCRIGPLTWDGLEYLEKVVDEGRVRVDEEKKAPQKPPHFMRIIHRNCRTCKHVHKSIEGYSCGKYGDYKVEHDSWCDDWERV